MLTVWDAAATMTGDLKGELPDATRFAYWIEHTALPHLSKQIEARAINKAIDARVLIVESPFHLCASKDAGKPGFSLHAWESEPRYQWAWKKANFQISSSPEPETTHYLDVKGWQFGNIGLHQSNGWTMTHVPSGLGFPAKWTKIKDAKAGVEAIHAEFDLTLVDRWETMSKRKKAAITKLINTHREFK